MGASGCWVLPEAPGEGLAWSLPPLTNPSLPQGQHGVPTRQGEQRQRLTQDIARLRAEQQQLDLQVESAQRQLQAEGEGARGPRRLGSAPLWEGSRGRGLASGSPGAWVLGSV